MDQEALRARYRKARFDGRKVFSHPFPQFKRRLKEAQAAEIPEVYALALAGIDIKRRPHDRMLHTPDVRDSESFWETARLTS